MKNIFFFFAVHHLVAATPHAYVTNHGDESVSVIDVANNSVQKIFGFSAPRVVEVTPDGLYAYVGSDDNTLRIIDTSTNTVLPVVIEVNLPSAISILPDGTYVYVASNNNTVSVISTVTYMIVDVIGGFSNPQDIVAATNRVYVTNAESNTVSVIQTSDNTIIDVIPGLSTPLGISITNDEAYVYVTNTGNNTISVIRTSDDVIVEVITGFNDPRYGAVAPDGDFVFVSDHGSDSILVVRISDNTIVGTIPILQPSSIALTPDGALGYVSSGSQLVGNFRTSDQTLFQLIPGFSDPSNISMALTSPPSAALSGYWGKDCFLLQTEFYHRITWSASPGSPVAYYIYRDEGLTNLAGIVGGGVLEFIDHNRGKTEIDTYYVMALYENGFSSTVGNIQVGP